MLERPPSPGSSLRAARASFAVLAGALALALVLALTLGISVGAVSIPASRVWGVALDHLWPGAPAAPVDGISSIIWTIRFPRALLAAVTGAGLAVVGVALQGTTRNPLADPYLFGISAGAAFGAVLVIVHIGDVLGVLTLPLAAFAGAMLSFGLVIGVSGLDEQQRPDRLVLAGVAVSFILMAATNLAIFMGDQRAVHSVVFWMLGGLGLARWDNIALAAPVVAIGIGVLLLHARALDALLLGEETARTLGVMPARLRLTIFMVCALMTGVLVSLTGAIGFIGLMMPHVARALVGRLTGPLIVTSALLGSTFLVLVDAISRTATSPQELPLGIVTSAIGGFAVIMMLRKRLS